MKIINNSNNNGNNNNKDLTTFEIQKHLTTIKTQFYA